MFDRTQVTPRPKSCAACRAFASGLFSASTKLGRPLQNDAAKVVLLAERKAGEKLRELERSPLANGGDTGGNQWRRPTSDAGTASPYAAALDESGTSRQQANVWQKVADVPEDDFARYALGLRCPSDRCRR